MESPWPREPEEQSSPGRLHVGVPLEGGAQSAQGGEEGRVKEAPPGQDAVQGRGGVALGEEEAVPVRVLGTAWIKVHHLKIQYR